MLGFPEAGKAHILAELPQQCSAWSWAESLITNQVASSLSPALHFLAWTCGPQEDVHKGARVLGAVGGEDVYIYRLKDFGQEILDRRKMFIISDILKCRQLGGIFFFPDSSAFSSSTLARSTVKISSSPMRCSSNDSNDLFSIKPKLPLWPLIVFWTP